LGSLRAFLSGPEVGLVVDRKPIPKTYSDGEGHILTEWQWMALPQKERERIEKLVDQKIKQVLKGGTV
jgi:hypothetical protein